MRGMDNAGWAALSGLGLLVLAACGGGGTGGGDGSGADLFDARAAESLARGEAISAAGPTDLAALPPTESATFQGVAGLRASDDETLAGVIDMQVGFLGNSVTGAMGDFVNEAGQGWDGELALSNGALDRTPGPNPNAITADLDGDLTSPGGTAYSFDGDLGANLFGAGHEYVLGVFGGSLCQGLDCASVPGSFNAEQPAP